MQIKIEWQEKDLLVTLQNIQRVLGGKNAILQSIGETLLNTNRARHAQQVAPDGTPWKPLSPLTIGNAVWKKQGASYRKKKSMSLASARKEQGRRSGRILFNSGDMMRDFTYQVQGDSVVIGFRQTIAAYHHFGTGTNGPKGSAYTILPKNKRALAFAGIVRKKVIHPGIPSRPLIGIPEGDVSLIRDVVAEHIMSAVSSSKSKK